jgi:hypothetical protein
MASKIKYLRLKLAVTLYFPVTGRKENVPSDFCSDNPRQSTIHLYIGNSGNFNG